MISNFNLFWFCDIKFIALWFNTKLSKADFTLSYYLNICKVDQFSSCSHLRHSLDNRSNRFVLCTYLGHCISTIKLIWISIERQILRCQWKAESTVHKMNDQINETKAISILIHTNLNYTFAEYNNKLMGIISLNRFVCIDTFHRLFLFGCGWS